MREAYAQAPIRSRQSVVVSRACALVPAFEAAETVARVVDELRALLDIPVRNRGKGAALLTGFRLAARRGFAQVVTVDADGQHPAASARAVLHGSDDPRALVLGVRELARDGAPRSNQFGNNVSNFFVSHFAGRRLRDTQCGLRRYPVLETLDLGAHARGYAFEAEVVLRAVAAGLPVVEVPVPVIYGPAHLGRSHFHSVRDPARIVGAVVRTVLELRLRGR